MHVVQIITKLELGGAQRTVVETCRQLSGEFHLTVVSGPEGSGASTLESEITSAGADVVIASSLVRAIRPLHDALALWQLVWLLRRLRPDIVHTHSSKAGILGRLAATLARVPCRVHTVHGWSFREGQSPLRQLVYRLAERVVATITTRIVVVAAADRAAGVRYRIGHAEKYRIIRSGVALDSLVDAGQATARHAARDLLDIPTDAFVVGTVSRLAWPKDPATLARAVSEVEGAWLVVVGDGPDRRAFEGEVDRLGLRGRTVLAGERDEIAKLLPAFDVFVLSSRSEGLPRVILEAAAARVPVVASDVGGTSEFIRDGVNGYLVPPGDAQSLAHALRRLRADQSTARRLADRAAVDVQAFSAEAMGDELRVLYQSLAGARDRTIVVMVRSLEIGGAERQALVLAAGLRDEGKAVHLVVFRGGPLADAAEESGLLVHVIGKGGAGDIVGFAVRLVRVLRRLRPGVVLSYLDAANIAAVAVRPFVPGSLVVLGVRSSLPPPLAGPRTSRWAYAIEGRLARYADAAIANSHAGFERAISRGFPSDRIVVIPNGIDGDRFRRDDGTRERMRSAWGITPGTFLVGRVARPDPVKGAETFHLAAVRVLAERGDVAFLTIGDEEFAVPPVAGRPTMTNIEDAYCAFDVLVSSARSGEGFPNVIAEAMACGVPCVATESGDTGLLIDATGLVVPLDDAAALAKAIIELLDPVVLRTLGARAADRIATEYSVDRLVCSTLDFVTSLR